MGRSAVLFRRWSLTRFRGGGLSATEGGGGVPECWSVAVDSGGAGPRGRRGLPRLPRLSPGFRRANRSNAREPVERARSAPATRRRIGAGDADAPASAAMRVICSARLVGRVNERADSARNPFSVRSRVLSARSEITNRTLGSKAVEFEQPGCLRHDGDVHRHARCGTRPSPRSRCRDASHRAPQKSKSLRHPSSSCGKR